MHPSGVDFIGFTNEEYIQNNIYSFYTFGFPSLAATGFNYYENYSENGLNATIGIGIGSVLFTSIAYQWNIGTTSYLKF